MEPDQNIEELAFRFLQGKCTPEEEAALHKWYEEQDKGDELVVNTGTDSEADIKSRLYSALESNIRNGRYPVVSIFRGRKNWLYAASIILPVLIGSALFYYANDTPRGQEHYTRVFKGDVGPGGNNAILELADGSVIDLDDAALGTLANSSGIEITKLADGMLSMKVSSKSGIQNIASNIIRTPAGGQYQVELPDGSHVWLNAKTSIKFPGSFTERKREVEIEGEAYLSIVKSTRPDGKPIPFIVVNKTQRIEVLGTEFNVSAYDGEVNSTTLIEGSVKINVLGSAKEEFLTPGQRSKVDRGTIQIEPADIESAISWKNGDFIFHNESLESIMKKIERWYDVEVIYQTRPSDLKFTAAISRRKNLSSILQIIEQTGKAKFKIIDRRVLVME